MTLFYILLGLGLWLVFWFSCGYFAAGYWYAYIQGHYPGLAETERGGDIRSACVASGGTGGCTRGSRAETMGRSIPYHCKHGKFLGLMIEECLICYPPEPKSPAKCPQVEIIELRERVARLEVALIQLRDCDWAITLPDRMDAVRKIARDALLRLPGQKEGKA